eukprot:2792154-Pyramimonas_sp.AAC.1
MRALIIRASPRDPWLAGHAKPTPAVANAGLRGRAYAQPPNGARPMPSTRKTTRDARQPRPKPAQRHA